MACVICNKPDMGGAVMLCKKHWSLYQKKSQFKNKKEHEEFKIFRKKIEDGLIKHREI